MKHNAGSENGSYSKTFSAGGTEAGSKTESCGDTLSYGGSFGDSKTPCEDSSNVSYLKIRTARFSISSKDDRDKLYAILASNGYKVWQETEPSYPILAGNDYWVCVEYVSKEKE